MRVTGGTVLLASDGLVRTDLTLADGGIDRIGGSGGGLSFDATGLLVLPGIVDLHGDAFERQIQPRPGVDFPVDLALRDTESQLLANGITTAFHGVTLSWEPGLRSLTAWQALLDALDAGSWTCDMRVHLRWEAYNLEALDTAVADIEAGRVHLLAFNDHTPSILKKLKDPVEGAKYSGRAGMKMEAFRAMTDAVASRAEAVPAGLDRIAAAARAAGLPMASHDDDSIAVRDAYRARGAAICEFPMAEEVGRAAVEAGDFVVMGCPNVVRGGSHLGWASAARLAEAGICTVLTSDYYYPAMMRAAFVLADRGVLDLAKSWRLISGNPARAGGLTDRGVIEAGKRADLVVVDPATSRAVATIVGGRVAFITAEGSRRLTV
ncbi:alpha-D-ribose 1-methylphosphonate 5-triphosphate diphosphatase [Acidisphaera sp. S103]|uniref:alpha-D-ribose 1-methylphosphonate 5-triphosphate diphosphatase n=1 Tax=Acidisphaera sp. S103 TaxID=1747223 RepID=UPI00131CB705|nr:alpha-D-ribose 1-methylphosphonate 5-triphosphate diphosphatase [Acidisphaera sp. S103]